jgi:hypothetical protein
LKVTLPAGVPPAPVTVALKVTGWPNWLGLADEVRPIVVATWPTERLNVELADALFVSVIVTVNVVVGNGVVGVPLINPAAVL